MMVGAVNGTSMKRIAVVVLWRVVGVFERA
jgi:hypothetical protein